MSKQYLFRAQIFNKKNFNPLSIAAFYSGETQYNINNNKTYQSESETKALWNEMFLPKNDSTLYEHLPDYLKIRNKKKDIVSNARNILWQKVDSMEKRADSQFARLFELSIPHFLNSDESYKLIEEFTRIMVNDGMIVDASIHSANNNIELYFSKETPHDLSKQDESDKKDYSCFLLCTLRTYKDGKFQIKNREWNTHNKLLEWRDNWVKTLANHIENAKTSDENKNAWKKKLNIYPEYIKPESREANKP